MIYLKFILYFVYLTFTHKCLISESPAYITKFRACLTRALEMVRSHVKRVLETATSAASPQDISGAVNQSAFTLLWQV